VGELRHPAGRREGPRGALQHQRHVKVHPHRARRRRPVHRVFGDAA
jgi:hypothetical protein